MADYIEIRGARVHNLKNIDLNLPLGKLVGIAGVSGSGKSSLALGILLSGFGYVSGIGAEQSGTAIRGIVLSSSLIPAMIFGMGVAALCFYPITKKYNEQMQAELADRRSKAGY